MKFDWCLVYRHYQDLWCTHRLTDNRGWVKLGQRKCHIWNCLPIWFAYSLCNFYGATMMIINNSLLLSIPSVVKCFRSKINCPVLGQNLTILGINRGLILNINLITQKSTTFCDFKSFELSGLKIYKWIWPVGKSQKNIIIKKAQKHYISSICPEAPVNEFVSNLGQEVPSWL